MSEEITTVSWGSRLKNAVVGILAGLALLAGAFVLIFWNERHSLHTAQSLEQTHKVVISVPITPINSQNNLKVVYINGLATTKEQITDSVLDITVNAINLNRKVEMYQWEEKTTTKTESQTGGSEKQIKTYSYDKTWSSTLIDSSTFKEAQGHQNPKTFLVPSKLSYAKVVTVGDFHMPEELIVQISKAQPINLNQVDIKLLQTQYKRPVSLYDNVFFRAKQSRAANWRLSGIP